MKNPSVLFIFLVTGILLHSRLSAQSDKNFVGVVMQANSYPQLDMVFNYSFLLSNSTLSSKSLFGGEVNIYYGRSISPSTELRIGLLGGFQPYGIMLNAINFDPNAPNKRITDDLSGYSIRYLGWKIETEFRLWKSKNSKDNLVIYPGIITVFHIPMDISLKYINVFEDGSEVTLFEVEEIIVNKDNKVSIGGTLGIGYRRQISERIRFSLGTNIMYSGRTVMETEGEYKLNSLDITRTGSFSQRFMSAGFNMGFSCRL